ncbi:hypothetical protein HYFRA_00012649, partial [Hymenoscyphus fraxineus]
ALSIAIKTNNSNSRNSSPPQRNSKKHEQRKICHQKCPHQQKTTTPKERARTPSQRTPTLLWKVKTAPATRRLLRASQLLMSLMRITWRRSIPRTFSQAAPVAATSISPRRPKRMEELTTRTRKRTVILRSPTSQWRTRNFSRFTSCSVWLCELWIPPFSFLPQIIFDQSRIFVGGRWL